MLPRKTWLSDVRTLCDHTDKSYMGSSLFARSWQRSSDLWGHSPMNDGVWIRDGNESHEKPGHELSSSDTSTKSACQRSSPGILVFSHRRHLGHMNRRALELTGPPGQAKTGQATTTLSRLVSELRVQIQDTLDHRRQADIWERFELKRDMVEAGRKILLRGRIRSEFTERLTHRDRSGGDRFRHATLQVDHSKIRHSIVEGSAL